MNRGHFDVLPLFHSVMAAVCRFHIFICPEGGECGGVDVACAVRPLRCRGAVVWVKRPQLQYVLDVVDHLTRTLVGLALEEVAVLRRHASGSVKGRHNAGYEDVRRRVEIDHTEVMMTMMTMGVMLTGLDTPPLWEGIVAQHVHGHGEELQENATSLAAYAQKRRGE